MRGFGAVVVGVVLALGGCGGGAVGGGPGDAGGEAGAPLEAPLVVHEWGTLTSLQGSDGAPVEGVGHLEAAPPGFVPRAGLASAGATQQLQTPVLYFRAAAAGRVRVTLDFPDGAFTGAWPPAAELASGGALAGGALGWELDLDPAAAAAFPAIEDAAAWAALRDVEATPVSAPGLGTERFATYWAHGRLDPLVAVRSGAFGTLEVDNASGEALAGAWLVHVHAGGGAFRALGEVPAGASVVAAPTPKERDPDAFSRQATAGVAAALVEAGLTADEAEAVLGVWEETLFRTWGLRLLYLLPRAWVDERLPLGIEPAPEALARVWVARVEVLTAWEEAALAEELRTAAPEGPPDLLERLGVFAEPKLRRVRALLTDPAAIALCDALIAEAAAAP